MIAQRNSCYGNWLLGLLDQATRGSPGGSGAWLTLLEHDRYPIAREQLFANLQGLGFISSEDRCHRDALGQVSDQVYPLDLDLSKAKSAMQLVHS